MFLIKQQQLYTELEPDNSFSVYPTQMYENQLILHQNQTYTSSEYTNAIYFMAQKYQNQSLNLVNNSYEMELKQHIQVQLVEITKKIKLFKIVAAIILIFFIFVMLMIGKVGLQGQNSWNLPFIAVAQRSIRMGQHPAIVQSKSKFVNISKIYNNIKYDKSSNQRQKKKKIPNIKQLNQMARQAVNQLVRPTNTKLRAQIVNFLPYSQSPHCLIVRQFDNSSKQYQSQIVKSIFNQQYDNFVTIFVHHENKPLLSPEQIQKIEHEMKKKSQSNPRIYYFINKLSLSYFDYKYLIQNLCVEKSTVFIVNSLLKPDALLMSHRFHQLSPVYLTFSQNQSKYTVNSFLMRVFDLIQQNDFTGTNLQYLKQPNQQCLLALALLELSGKYTKKISLATYYQQSQKQQQQNQDFSIRKDDQSFYDRYPYQMLLTLSQTYYIDNIDQMLGNLLQIEDGQFKQKEQTQLTELQRVHFIQQRQAPYLPNDSALSVFNFRRLNRKYGEQANFEGSSMTNIVERPICAVMIGQSILNNAQIRVKKHLQTIQQVLNQNYTNFHVVYINDGLSQQIEAEIKNKISNNKNIQYVKNKQPKYLINNIVKSAYKYCNQNQILTVIDSSVSNLNQCLFLTVNNFISYNPDVWVVYSNYMTSATMETGAAHRIFKDIQYVREGKRVTNLNYLSPMPFIQVKLLKKIPFQYLKDQKGEWLKSRCLKSLEHCLAQLSSTYRMEYLPQIMFEYDDEDMFKRDGEQFSINLQKCDSSLQIYVGNMKVLSPLGSLDIGSTEAQSVLYQQFK